VTSPLPLDILVYTYNRSESLARVLDQFASSPFKDCAFTVLDNCSTDRTPDVCKGFESRFGNFRAIRHPRNIGGDANYLRAVELARAEYTWAVCDDDSFDFSRGEDIVEALAKRQFDLISVRTEDSDLPGGYEGPVLPFALSHPFFIVHSFIPSLIFRTALFDSALLRRAYASCDTMFPHFPFLSDVVRRNASIYVSRQAVIRKGTIAGYSAGRFMSGWLECCKRVEDVRIRRKAAAEVFSGRRLFVNAVYFILTERAVRPGLFWGRYRQLCAGAFSLSIWLWLKVLLFLPLAACPRAIHRGLWKCYKKYRERRGMPLPGFDDLR